MPMEIFFDMDGCLAVFERFDKAHPENIPFLRPGAHYFLQCEEDAKLWSIFMRLFDYERAHPDEVRVHVLTRLYPDNPMESEWRHDKTKWIRLKFPEFPVEERLHFTHSYKGEFLREFRAANPGLKGPFVLLDDQNENLKSWQDEGGVAVKYGNGINNPNSWPGCVLYRHYTEPMIWNEIMACAAGETPD